MQAGLVRAYHPWIILFDTDGSMCRPIPSALLLNLLHLQHHAHHSWGLTSWRPKNVLLPVGKRTMIVVSGREWTTTVMLHSKVSSGSFAPTLSSLLNA